jgi:hypothetical protein
MTQTAIEDVEAAHGECWCCGCAGDVDRMVHLGNHPEVTLCLRCAHWASKQAAGLEDRDRSGPLPIVRDVLRTARRQVIDHGLHRNPIIGAPLRWLGKRLP